MVVRPTTISVAAIRSEYWVQALNRSGRTAEQIAIILRQGAPDSAAIGNICRDAGITQATFLYWHNTYAGMTVREIQRHLQLEEENGRLRRLSSELMADIDTLRAPASEPLIYAAQSDKPHDDGAAILARRRRY